MDIKVSVVIPVYNAEKYLHYSLRSVQNQKMKDIEIIIVDDNSKDNSIKLIHDYMEKDKRIRLIENKINRKILFSKSIGALNSKGKYIIELDQDDMFIRDDAFDIIYNESEKYDLDFLSFGYISSKNASKKIRLINNFVKEKNIIMKQPNLKFSIFKEYNGLLWGNLIKANLYKKVIYYLWPIIINYKIIFQEDFLITFFILIYAEKAEKIEKKIFFNYYNKKSISKIYKNNYESSLSIIFVGNIFYDYYIEQNQKDIQLIINYIDFMATYIKQGKNLHLSFFNYLFEKILSNAYLPKKIKGNLMKTFNVSTYFNSIKNLNANLILEIPTNSHNQNEQLIKISIIIICSNFESVKIIIIVQDIKNS
jgi:glycosyltransferase involved in cell wall biosynthesis